MTKLFFFTLSVTLLFINADCKKNIVEPPIDNVKPGSRNYTWTVDTLKLSEHDLFTPTRIWGSAPNDVWVAGFGDASWNLLWHYDGIRWKKDSLQRQISPSALWGTSSNNIWLGNYSHNSFWRYDGTKWYKFSEHTPPSGFDMFGINNFWGTSLNDIWAVGSTYQINGGDQYKGIISYFNGSQWQFVQLPDLRVSFVDIRKQNSTGLFFLEATEYDQNLGTISKLFTFDGTHCIEIFSSTQHYATVNEINGRVYLIHNQKIFQFKNNYLTVWKDFSQTSFLGKIYGRSEKDFFSFATDGIGHYNGADFKTVFPIDSDFRISNGFVLDSEVFFPCYSITKNISIVIHGVLKNNSTN